ncbi:hypothetical protein TKK_0000462 [Trichogramma kaykai]|uniref:RRM domain-containing protein n=1 Tax=Trichogramma kaykai TaxID=54128 RepID=A0ABD2WL01_9HYME
MGYKSKVKKARIVIRNLPFSVTDEQIKERFSQYGGRIYELNRLSKNGKPTGCCFIQFDAVNVAAKAIRHENDSLFVNRKIIVDWAVPKNKFQQSEVKKEDETNEDCKPDISVIDVESQEQKDDDSVTDVKVNDVKSHKQDDEESDEDSDEDVKPNVIKSEDSDDDDDDEEEDSETDVKVKDEEPQQPRQLSNDVNEGRTVFLRNVPFQATNEDLKNCMSQFGPVVYAVRCIDELTEHPKGTAFVKFVNPEDAEKCLSAGTELTLRGQILDPHKALSKEEVKEKSQEKKQKKTKDSRNLYLVKEGVILASLPAAKEVSAQDMEKRLALEKWKSQMLRNLAMFVSRNRLVCHNLPPSCDDKALRQIFLKYGGPQACITEAKVMRDLRNLDDKGNAKSKEHGFITFTRHEDALRALRAINNNPSIFTRQRRPIVSFSIENRAMINARANRLEKSKLNNPNANKRANSDKTSDAEPDKKRQRFDKKSKMNHDGTMSKQFAGTESKPGTKAHMGKFFLRKQAKIHNENIKEKKKQIKSKKQLTEKIRDQAAKRRDPKPKQGAKKDKDEVNFNKIVNKYKNQLATAQSQEKRSKWYESK